MTFDILFHPFVMMWMGQLLHMLKVLKELENANKAVTIRQYIALHPYSVAFSFFAGFVAYGFLYSANQLTMAGAFTAGYMADSIISSFTDKTLRSLDKDEAQRRDRSRSEAHSRSEARNRKDRDDEAHSRSEAHSRNDRDEDFVDRQEDEREFRSPRSFYNQRHGNR